MKKLVLAAIASAISFNALSNVLFEEVKDQGLVDRIKANQPAKVVAVYKTEMAGIYEIHTEEKQSFYTNDEATHFFINAQLVNFKKKVNYTQERKFLTNLTPWDELPHAASFTVKKGDGKQKIAVFTDPDCPYCKRIEGHLKQLDNITISYFMMPIEKLHPEAPQKAAIVMCSKDKAAAWENLMTNNFIDLSAPTCYEPIDTTIRFAKEKRIQATPTLINERGYLMEGAPSLDRLKTFIQTQ